MFQYAWICLNNDEYDWICQHIPEKKKPSAEYTRILYVSHAIYNNKYLYKLLSSYQNKDI